MIKKRIFLRISAFLLVVFISGFGVLLEGLDPHRGIDQYNLEVYSTEDGLPQSSILSLIQTGDGYIWMGTYEGIARFDGIRFEIFNKLNTAEMASNRIKCLLEDSSGNLWIGTSGGLLFYSEGVFKNYTTGDGLSNDFVTTLYEDKRGRLWVGTTDGLNCFEKGVFTAYAREQGLNHIYILTLVEDSGGNILIGTSGGGLYILRHGKIDRKVLPGLTADLTIRVLYKDKQGCIWIGTGEIGLVKLKNGKTRIYSKKDGLSGNDIRAIFQDTHGAVWIGTNGQGLNRLKDGSFSYSASSRGFLDRQIRSIMEDREGSLWIGSRDGLSQLKDGKFIIYNSRSGLPVDSVRTVFQDRDKNIWFGTVNGGLVCFKNGRFEIFALKEGLRNKHIWTIAQSRDGSIWFGTYGGGLHRLKKGKIIEIYSTEKGLANDVVRAVFVDRKDRVWVGTNGGGVDVIRDGKIFNYSTKNGLSGNFVYAINEDKEGDIWVGTYSGNINRFRDGEIKVYSVKDGLTGSPIWSIYPDDEGTIWIGTDGSGLLRFRDDKFSLFTVKEGLYSDLAFYVFEDLQKNLWMNCNQGIYSIKKKNVQDFLAGKINKIPYISFGKTEGMKSTECNGPAQPAGLCSTDGRLWFPTIRGAVVIDQENIKINETLPPVIIEEMITNEKTVYSYPSVPGERLILPPGRNRVEFKYTALSFTAPGRVRFKYKLKGFEKKWFDAGTWRRVFYTNIPPGDYTFRVIACNNDGKWNNKGASFSFTFEPFFYQTWWFRILFLVLFSIFSYLVISFIKKHMKLIAFWKKKKYIGSYEIDEQIGIGGMGIVYKVHSLMDRNKTYALKVMKEEHLLDEVQKKRFKNESLLVDRLDHPNIVKVYERGEDKDKLYIVMELLEGLTLAERYGSDDYPSVEQCIHILGQAADILVNLHGEEIIHRDLKPENIMLVNRKNDPDFVKLLDFGIARVKTFTHLTETGQVVGTLSYMPPEVISDGLLLPAADIYSLGVIGYEMITRQKPFPADKPLDIIKQIVDTKPREPREVNPRVPRRLNNLILKMIEKNPDNRPDAAVVLAILRELLPTSSIPKRAQ
jgi:ligand-binding sensor domain-containing protein/tRNA A-37 threonylcarbamoyl transferase component Bud32